MPMAFKRRNSNKWLKMLVSTLSHEDFVYVVNPNDNK